MLRPSINTNLTGAPRQAMQGGNSSLIFKMKQSCLFVSLTSHTRREVEQERG